MKDELFKFNVLLSDINNYVARNTPADVPLVRDIMHKFILAWFSSFDDSFDSLKDFYNPFKVNQSRIKNTLFFYDKRMFQFDIFKYKNIFIMALQRLDKNFYTYFFTTFFENVKITFPYSDVANDYTDISDNQTTDQGKFTDFEYGNKYNNPNILIVNVDYSVDNYRATKENFSIVKPLLSIVKAVRVFPYFLFNFNLDINKDAGKGFTLDLKKVTPESTDGSNITTDTGLKTDMTSAEVRVYFKDLLIVYWDGTEEHLQKSPEIIGNSFIWIIPYKRQIKSLKVQGLYILFSLEFENDFFIPSLAIGEHTTMTIKGYFD